MKRQWELFIFDFDGVLVDSGADIINAIQYTLASLGQPRQEGEQIISHIGHGVEKMIRGVLAGADENTIKAAIPIYRQYYLEHAVEKTLLYPHVKEILMMIKNNLHKKTAIVTSKPEDLTRTILKGLEVSHYFGLVVGPESVACMKPDPEGINQVLTHFGVEPSQAIMIGDMPSDIEAGQRARVNTCAVTYGFGIEQELVASAPDIIIDDMAKLLTYI